MKTTHWLPQQKPYLLLSLRICLLGIICLIWTGRLQAEPTTEGQLFQAIQSEINTRWLSTLQNPKLQAVEFTSEQLNLMLSKHLSQKLLNSAQKIRGVNYNFPIQKQSELIEAQMGVLVLSYADKKTAQNRAKDLETTGKYFQNTKILTPFSFTTLDSELIIIFTEKAGNDEWMKWILALPERVKIL